MLSGITGVPVWLHYEPGCVFRTATKPYMYHMKKFMTKIVNMVKEEKLFASQGGPIILAQVENEYGGWYEEIYGEKGKEYAMWAAHMALSQNTGVPWVMCVEQDAPYPVIDTCNSFYCDQFAPNNPLKPKIWTENWPGWYMSFGSPIPHRPPEDIAFSVARFFEKGGSVQNYYMYHGGTNFGRTGGSWTTTSYDYDAPIDEYGLPRFPTYGHLKELHRAIKLCEKALLTSDSTFLYLGPQLEADVYDNGSGDCAAFLANVDNTTDAVVVFRNVSYLLPAWSVSITAKVGFHTSIVQMVPKKLKVHKWQVFEEKAALWTKPDLSMTGFVDHLNTTKDNIYVEEKLLKGSQPVISIQSKGDGFHFFLNNEYQGSAYGDPAFLEQPTSLEVGKNDIALMSFKIGLPKNIRHPAENAGGYYEWVGTGVTSANVSGLSNGTLELSGYPWKYKIGLEGESLKLSDGLHSANWATVESPPKYQPLTWYKIPVKPPSGHHPVRLNMIHMGKGQAWLNGYEIGRYWNTTTPSNAQCVEYCNYRGAFNQFKCGTGCGDTTQRWYHVPWSWFKPSGNVLVVFEEVGGDPTMITFSNRKISNVCTLMSEDHPPSVESWSLTNKKDDNVKATARLSCPDDAHISAVKFASFGNPEGDCGFYSTGGCHDPQSASVVEKLCLGKKECIVELSEKNFDKGLCPGTVRRLAVEAVCS